MPLQDTVLPLQNAEITKQVSVARQAQVDLEREKRELEDSFQRISEQAQRKVSGREPYGLKRLSDLSTLEVGLD